MQIPSDIVGLRLPERAVEVDWRRTTNFAAAVGDDNPRFLDDSREGGLQVHPVFPVVLSWPLITELPQLLADRIAPEAFLSMVHGSQRIRYHRPLSPGDELVMSGRVKGAEATRAGALLTIRLEVSDRTGARVYTEELGGLFRGVELAGPPAGGGGAGSQGASLQDAPSWEADLPIPAGAAFVYDGCTDIVFPIHTSQAFARSVGLAEAPLQGTCSLAMAVSQILHREAGGAPAQVEELACVLRRPVLPGTTVRLKVWSVGGDRVRFRLVNQAGQVALQDGALRRMASQG